MHYLDHAATTPVSPQAAQAMVEVMTEQFANPSAQYEPAGPPGSGWTGTGR